MNYESVEWNNDMFNKENIERNKSFIEETNRIIADVVALRKQLDDKEREAYNRLKGFGFSDMTIANILGCESDNIPRFWFEDFCVMENEDGF